MTPYSYHRLLLRQIKKITGSYLDIEPQQMQKLIQVVSITYEEYEKSQERSNRAANLMSEELLELNQRIKDDAKIKLELSEQKYYNMVQNISGIIFSYYWHNGKITTSFITHQIEKVTGYSAEDFISGTVNFLDILHLDDLPKYLEILHSKPFNNLYQLEYRLISKDNNEMWVYEQGKISDDNGKIKVDSVIVDISPQKEVEQKLTDIAQQEKEANRAKSEFLSNMSHELRTPMHSILSYAELGASGIELQEPIETIKTSFEMISKSGERLLKILNSLLDLARMESGKMRYRFANYNISNVIEQAEAEIKPLANKKSIAIIVEYPEQLIDIYIDANSMIQVFINLLSNAVKFSPVGGEVRILIENRQEPDYLIIDVVDNGVGIPEEQLESIFNAFVQSSRTSEGGGGTGLGLSITNQIMNAHNGKIWAFNNPDKGASFRLEIPRKVNMI